MNQQTNGFDLIRNDLVGDQFAERLAALLDTVSAGSILWAESKIADLRSSLVIHSGMPEVLDGYQPYTRMLMVDEGGALLTLTGSSWGLRNAGTGLIAQIKMIRQSAFPVVTLGSRPSGNQFGTINPTLDVVSWVPRTKFAAILGETPEPAAIEAPKQEAAASKEPETKAKVKKPTASQIIDDEIPW